MRLFVLIRNFILGEPHIGNAVKSLNKAVVKVQKAADYQSEKATREAEKAAKAQQAAADATAHAERASKVGKNLSNLLCLDDDTGVIDLAKSAE